MKRNISGGEIVTGRVISTSKVKWTGQVIFRYCAIKAQSSLALPYIDQGLDWAGMIQRGWAGMKDLDLYCQLMALMLLRS